MDAGASLAQVTFCAGIVLLQVNIVPAFGQAVVFPTSSTHIEWAGAEAQRTVMPDFR
jgi:hypothetical protein